MRPENPSFLTKQRVPTERELLDDLAVRALAWLWCHGDDRPLKERQDDLAVATDRLATFRRVRSEGKHAEAIDRR